MRNAAKGRSGNKEERTVTRLHSIALTALTVFGLVSIASAQEPAPAPAGPAKALVPLEVEVVITRFEGTKKISSLPYVLAVNANGIVVQLNMGTQVAVPSASFTPVNADSKATPLMSYSYKDVGTKISAMARSVDNGFDLQLNIDDSSVYTNPTPGGGQMPAFRNFSTRNNILLRDGQTREYTAAVDRVSGEVVKVSVTLKVVK